LIDPNDPVRRCCPTHDSLDQLTHHLMHEFDQLTPIDVAREVARATAAAAWIGLVEDELLIIELIARVHLELQIGRRVDVARLDPQHHSRRLQPAGLSG
jgi:hypothetical protein